MATDSFGLEKIQWPIMLEPNKTKLGSFRTSFARGAKAQKCILFTSVLHEISFLVHLHI